MRDETGSVLIISLVLMVALLGLGYAAAAETNVQTHQTGSETAGEAAFNMAESALDAQSRLLELNWPGTTASTTACNQSTAPSSTCPGTGVTNSFSSTYAGQEYSNPTWTTEIGGVCPTSNTTCTSSGESPSYYSDPIPTAAEGCDCYSANAVWLRSQATVLGQTRVVVGEIQRQSVVVPLPDNTIIAGGVNTSNNGNKAIIDETDSAPGSALTGTIDLTCGTSSTPVSYQSGCAGWDASKSNDQASPGTYQAGYSDPNGYSLLSSTQLASLEQAAPTAPAAGTCPSSWSGLIYIQSTPSTGCTITDNGSGCSKSSTPSSSATPGMIIVGSGSITVAANNCYYGVVYAVNTGGPTPSSGECTTTNSPVTLAANSIVYGALFADNCGLVTVGQASGQTATVYFDSLALSAASAHDTPVLAKNTFRILQGY